MGTVDLVELLARCAAMQVEALAALSPSVTCDAVARYWHVQESWPYWTNRLGTIALEGVDGGEWGEQLEQLDATVVMRLVVGHVTSGYRGEREGELARWASQAIDWFNARPRLTSATYPARMTHLLAARVTACRGLVVFGDTGIGAQQIGTELELTARFLYALETVTG